MTDRPAAAPAVPVKVFAVTLGLFNFGASMAILTPVMITLPLKIQTLVAPGHQAGAFGLVAAVGAVFAIVFNPLGGRLSDRTTSRFGRRRPWILGGAAGGLLSLLLMAEATSLWMLVLGWCLVEIFINTALAAANATVADQIPEDQRGFVSGIFGIGLPLALLSGSVIVNAFSEFTARFLVPGALMLVFALLFVAVLPDRRLQTTPEAFSMKSFALSFVFNPRRHPDFGWLWIGRFAIMFGVSGVQTYLVYLLGNRLGLNGGELTSTIVLANLGSCVATIASSYLMGALSDRFGRRKPFVAAASVLVALGLSLTAFAPDRTAVIIAGIVSGIGAGGFAAVDLALATLVLPDPDDAGKDLGVLAITNGLPQSVVPAIAPAVIALGTSSVNGYSLLYLLGAAMAVLGALSVSRIKTVR
ncbi:MFS transporter [Streptomyces sp. NPDC091215]|uniref:MFS transporter n=1 Tax=Streptomyces sp. NPDC091215 TaxID=3155192 RepID=UPI0034241C25